MKNETNELPALRIPVSRVGEAQFASVKFTFVEVTPELAAEWLKRNRRNRKIRKSFLEAYITDMRNGAWLTTHEGIAFDEDGNLMDGQHRLEALVHAKRTVLMVVSTGWPTSQRQKKTMDVVNMGANRSLADQLHLQHGVEKRDAAQVVKICNSIVAASFGMGRVRRSTTDTILGVFALYKPEILWLLANPVKIRGLGQATVLAALAMHYALFPKPTEEALRRLVTGADLASGNPLLPLRNWLMSSESDVATVRQAVFHHLYAFKRGQSVSQVCLNNDEAYLHVMDLSQVRMEKICAIYGGERAPGLGHGQASSPPTDGAFSAQAVRVGGELPRVFTSTDVVARTEANAGQWLLAWLNKGWIESAGVNQYRRTEKFGK